MSPLPRGSISGTVIDNENNLLEGALVSADIGQSTITDENGDYILANVPVGARTISASAPGYTSDFAYEVTVVVDIDTPNVDFVLEPAIVAPNDFAQVEAASWSSTFDEPIRLQEVYASSHFGTQPLMITGMGFRLDNPIGANALALDPPLQQSSAVTNSMTGQLRSQPARPSRLAASPREVTTIDVTIRLSTTTKQPDALSAMFADNIGADVLKVFDGVLSVDATGDAGPGEPNPFEIVFDFVDALGDPLGFNYDPSAGNLLVDIITHEGSSTVFRVDTSSAGPTPDVAPDDHASRVFNWVPTAEDGARDTGADVIEFRWVPSTANQLPTVTLDTPVDGATFTAPTDIELTATASDGDGMIVRVEFYANDNLIGEDFNAPYTFTWSSISEGTYTLTALAVDELGGVGTSNSATVEVTNDDPPTTPTIHVNNIMMDVSRAGRNYKGHATVTIVNQSDQPVAGATVTGDWELGTSPVGSSNGITDSSGSVVLTSSPVKT